MKSTFCRFAILCLAIIFAFLGACTGTDVTAEPTAKSIPTITYTETQLPSETPQIEQETPTPEDDPGAILRILGEYVGSDPQELGVNIQEITNGKTKGYFYGGYFLAVEEDDEWIILYAGEDTPLCADVDPYFFPLELVPECLDSDGNKVIRTIDTETAIGIALSEYLDLPLNELSYQVTDEREDHAKGNVSNGYFLAALSDNEWVIVYGGQANPPCADINGFAFPLDMVPECLDENGNLIVRSTDLETNIAMALSDHLQIPITDLAFVISDQTDNHVKGNLPGGYFLATKTEDVWIIVHDGQATPPCVDIEFYGFPFEMVTECLDSNNDLVVRSYDDDSSLAYALSQILGIPVNELDYSINKMSDWHAKGIVSDNNFLAANVDGVWAIVYHGQTIPQCSDISPYVFPYDYVPECVDNDSKIVMRSNVLATDTYPAASLGAPAWSDTFNTAGNWPLYSDDHVGFDIDDGKLVMTAYNPDYWEGWMLTWPTSDDFFLEATLKNGDDCAGQDHGGIVFRQVRPDELFVGYLYSVSCDGRYILRIWDGGSYATLIPWRSSEIIMTGPEAQNLLSVLTFGSQIVLYINGQPVAEVYDSSYLSGNFGVLISAAVNANFTVEVDDMSYWTLP